MALRWTLLLWTTTACGQVVESHLMEPEVDVSAATTAPRADLTCVVTTPATGGKGTITYTASWQRDGAAFTGTPATTTFSNDTIRGADVTPGSSYQCTVTATDGKDTVTATSAAVTAACATGSMAMFSANGTPPNGTVQQFVVPSDVCKVTIEAAGAEGGVTGTAGATQGALITGTFKVNPGNVLLILVGQQAGMGGSGRLSGGGGTFVLGPGNMPLVVAGGGGSNFAGTIPPAESVGRAGTSGGTVGTSPRADNGMGGSSVAGSNSGAGGGLLSAGAGTGGGAGYNQGGAGGGSATEAFGGYGGGGGRTGLFGEGGGGGYSGGSCGDTANTWVGCGGGGSFNGGTNPTNTAGTVTGNGHVKITW